MAISMKADRCVTCGGVVFKLKGEAAKLCHDECQKCRARRELSEDERRAEIEAEERQRLEAEEMARHFDNHPYG